MSVINPQPVVSELVDLNGNNPRIGYHNVFELGEVSVSSETEGYEKEGAVDWLTWSHWLASEEGAAWIEVETDEPVEVDYVGIAAHELAGIEYRAQYHNGSDWVTLVDGIASENRVIFRAFDAVTATRFRLWIDSPAFVGVVSIGKSLQIPRRLYQGFAPPMFTGKTAIMPNKSEGGQWLGRSIVRRGVMFSFPIRLMKADWCRQYFVPFASHAIEKPFFFAWRPERYPAEAAYCWTAGEINAINSGPRDYMSAQVDVSGFV